MDIPFIPAHSSNYARGRTAPILWIVVHYTANDGDTDTNNAHYFQGAGRGASAHYFVDEDSITQTVRDSDTAWHCGAERGGSYFNGARNANSIGICYIGGLDADGKPKDTRTEEQKASLFFLLQQLREQFPDAMICGHRDFSPDLNGDGIIEPWEWMKACPCFDAIDEYQSL